MFRSGARWRAPTPSLGRAPASNRVPRAGAGLNEFYERLHPDSAGNLSIASIETMCATVGDLGRTILEELFVYIADLEDLGHSAVDLSVDRASFFTQMRAPCAPPLLPLRSASAPPALRLCPPCAPPLRPLRSASNLPAAARACGPHLQPLLLLRPASTRRPPARGRPARVRARRCSLAATGQRSVEAARGQLLAAYRERVSRLLRQRPPRAPSVL